MSFGLPYGIKGRDENNRLRSINTMHKERYVYYERLYEDAVIGKNTTWPELAIKAYNRAKDVFKWRIDHGSNHEDISGFFANLASYEFAKEEALLEKHFGITSYDPNSESCGKDLIEAYNAILNTQEIFERNALLLANTSQLNLIGWFPQYLNIALHEWIEDMGENKDFTEEVTKLVTKGMVEGTDESEKIAAAIQKIIDKDSFKITENALKLMFSENTKAENGLKKKVGNEKFNELGKAYKEIFNALNKLEKDAATNQFIKGVVKNFGLDKLGEMITDSFEKEELSLDNFKGKVDNFNFKVSRKSQNTLLKGGFGELFGLFNASITLDRNGVDMKGFHTGNMGLPRDQKADMMYAIGFNQGAAESIQKQLNKFEGAGRGTNVRDVKKLIEETFEKFGNDDSFMIMVNSKLWTPNWNFRNGYTKKDGTQATLGGYSAGSSIDLNTWDDMMHSMNVRGRDFIFTIMQLIPGAIGSPNGETENKEKVSDMFARAIGSALFDDFEPDDPYKKKGGADIKTIHLLYLNGVYIPLSVFYTLLAKAFGDFKDALERDELVQVTFTLPEQIKYPDWDSQKGVEHAWNIQQQIALDNIKVTYHFMRGYQKFLQQFYQINNP